MTEWLRWLPAKQLGYARAGSNPAVVVGQRVRVVKETDLKSVGLCPRRFESCRCRICPYSSVVEQQLCKLQVVGSIPTGGFIF